MLLMSLSGAEMKTTIKYIAYLVILAGANGLFAQTVGVPVSLNLVQLSASASVQAVPDLLAIALNTSREGGDASEVQSGLKADIDAALAVARSQATPGQMEARTANFSLHPRYGRDGLPMGWTGSAGLVLEGRDFARIGSTAGEIRTLTVSSVGFGLSRELQAKLESEAQTLAIERFKSRAGEIARGFGFSGYTLREINVNTQEPGFAGRPRMMAAQTREAAADAPIPVEAGKVSVMVSVSGSVQMK